MSSTPTRITHTLDEKTNVARRINKTPTPTIVAQRPFWVFTNRAVAFAPVDKAFATAFAIPIANAAIVDLFFL